MPNLRDFTGWTARGTTALLALVLCAFLSGVYWRPASQVYAQAPTEKPPDAFKSGAQRSEIVLREIADTLKQMDGRLERIEKALLRAVGE